jgi:DNA-binding SARP family transcriptional activator/WD40 repeat protein
MITASKQRLPGRVYPVAVEFRVLGPVGVTREGVRVHLGGPKQRLALALLLQADGRSVSTEALIDGVWGDEPPATARKTLQGYIHHLRGELGEIVRTEPNGYSLDTDDDLDAARFERLAAEGRAAVDSDPVRAAELLREALELWSGAAYSDLATEPSLVPEVARLENLRTTVLVDRIDADLALGRHESLIGELDALTQEFPLVERFRAQHMLALYRAGRQVEALRGYERTRRFLADEMGLDPSTELQTLEQQILGRDPSIDLEASTRSDDPTAVRGYELRELVATDGTSQTYRAYQRSIGREVSVRILGPEIADDPHFIATFLADAQLVAELEHPHVALVFDTWREPGRAFQVSRWLAGGTLRDALSSQQFGLGAAVRLLDQVGDALGYAHRRGVVHGHVTSDSVLLDETGNAYLADFVVGRDDPEATNGRDVAEFVALAHQLVCGREPAEVDGVSQVDAGDADVSGAVVDVFERAFRGLLTRPEEFMRALRQAVGVDVVPTAAAMPPLVEARNPYKGLRAFNENDADDFHGRDELVDRLVDELARHRLVAVIGPSGSGKSSVVKAGLAARLHARTTGPLQLVTEMFPGAFPFEELEAALLRVGVDRDSVIADLLGDRRGLMRIVKQVLPGDDAELVLVIDQFEELFSAVGDEQVRSLFLDSLTTAVSEPRSRFRVVVTMRADFFDRPLGYPEFGALVEAGLVPVSMPDDDGLAAAIARPARAVGVELEDGLVPQILRDIADQPGGLPLMQYALTELFDARESNRLTLAGYQRTGGVFGALGRRAEALYAGLDPAGQHAIRQAFLRLVTVEEGADDLRRRVRRVELTAADIDDQALANAINLFGAHRLLTFDLDPVTRGPTVEVAHEALLREWERLRGWIDAERDDLVIRRRLDLAMAEWQESGDDPSFLPTGGRLAQFEEWAATSSLSLSGAQRSYLEAGLERERAAESRAAARRRRVTVGLGVVAVLLAVLAGFALVQQRRADDAADDARDAAAAAETGRVGAASVAQAESNPALGLLLAAEAYRRDVGPASLGALQQTMLRTGHYLGTLGTSALHVEWTPTGLVALDQDGLTVYDGATYERTLRVDLEVALRPQSFAFFNEFADGEANPFAVAPSGQWAAVGVEGDRVEVVDLSDGSTADIATGARVTSLGVSADDALLAIGQLDGTVAIHRLDDLAAIGTIEPITTAENDGFEPIDEQFASYEDVVFMASAIAFDETAETIAIAQGPRMAVFDVASGEPLTSPVRLASFDADFPMMSQGIYFVDDEVWIHHFNTLTRVDRVDGDVIEVMALVDTVFFSEFRAGELTSDGTLLVVRPEGVVEFDVRSTFENARGFRQATILRTYRVPMVVSEGLALSPDGGRWAVAGNDGVVLGARNGSTLLSMAVPIDVEGDVVLTIGQQGNLVASGGFGATLWDLSADVPAAAPIPNGEELPWAVVSTSATGDSLLVGESIVARHYEDARPDGPFVGIENVARVGALSPDGRFIAYERCTRAADWVAWFDDGGGCDYGGVSVVDLESGDVVGFFDTEGDTPSLAWSADGGRLARTDVDGTVTMWDSATWEPIATPPFGQAAGEAMAVSYSPDGRYVATVAEDGVVSLRDPDDGNVISTLSAARNIVSLVDGSPWFDADGSAMLTTFDGAVRLWDVASGVQIGDPFPHDATDEAGFASRDAGGASGEVMQLATAVGDVVLVWNLDTSTWFDIACRAAGRNMTRAEWQQFGPADAEYAATCPQYDIEP